MYDRAYKLKEINRTGIRAQGGRELKQYLYGKRLTRKQAIKAICYDCMGYYSDGRQDCELPDCPLYGFMPYNKHSRIKS